MKRIIILVSVLALSVSVYAQEQWETEENSSEMKTLFSSETKASGFGAFDMTVTSLNDRLALLLGGHGGLLFNKKFMVGFGGYGISTPVQFDGTDPAIPLELNGGYGGVMMGYIFSPMEVIHLSTPFFIGVGGISVDEADFTFDPDNPFLNQSVERSTFVVLEPGVQMEVNIARFFRMGIGLSYRFTEGVDLTRNNINDEDTSGLSGNISFKFGGF